MDKRRFIKHDQTGEKLHEEGSIHIYEGDYIMWGTEWKETITRDDINWIVTDEDGCIWVEYRGEYGDEYGIIVDFNTKDIIVERQPVSDYVRSDIIGRLIGWDYKKFDTVESAYGEVLHERAVRGVK